MDRRTGICVALSPPILIFTDGRGKYPEICRENVLWILGGDHISKPPFGDFTYIEDKD